MKNIVIYLSCASPKIYRHCIRLLCASIPKLCLRYPPSSPSYHLPFLPSAFGCVGRLLIGMLLGELHGYWAYRNHELDKRLSHFEQRQSNTLTFTHSSPYFYSKLTTEIFPFQPLLLSAVALLCHKLLSETGVQQIFSLTISAPVRAQRIAPTQPFGNNRLAQL